MKQLGIKLLFTWFLEKIVGDFKSRIKPLLELIFEFIKELAYKMFDKDPNNEAQAQALWLEYRPRFIKVLIPEFADEIFFLLEKKKVEGLEKQTFMAQADLFKATYYELESDENPKFDTILDHANNNPEEYPTLSAYNFVNSQEKKSYS